MRTKIQIEKVGYIDLFDDIPVPITKSLADIKDLTNRSGGFTTTIEIPTTNNNLKIFGNLNNLDIKNSSFDLKRKYRCVIIKDDKISFYGFVKLVGIKSYEGVNGNSIQTLSITLYDDISSFFGLIRDKTLDQLYFDDIDAGYYNFNDIVKTFDYTYNDKYKYFLPTQTRGYYETLDFKLAIYAYEYIDRIIKTAGYNWNGSKIIYEVFLKTETINLSNSGGYGYISTLGSYFSDDNIGNTLLIKTGPYIGRYTILEVIGSNIVKCELINGLSSSGSGSGTYQYGLYRLDFKDPNLWLKLNNSINLDKLLIPYSGSKEIKKDLSEYDIKATQTLFKVSDFKYFYIDTGVLTIVGSSTIPSNVSINDIIKIELDTTTRYFEVLTINSVPGPGYDNYNVIELDSSFERQSTPPNFIGSYGNITILRGALYYSTNNFVSQNTGGYTGTLDDTSVIPYRTYFEDKDKDFGNMYSISYLTELSRVRPYGSFTASKNGDLSISINQNLDLILENVDEIYLKSGNTSTILYTIGIKVLKNNTILEEYSKYVKETDNGAFNAIETISFNGTPLPSSTGAIVYSPGYHLIAKDIKVQYGLTIPVVVGDVIKINFVVVPFRQWNNSLGPANNSPYYSLTYFPNYYSPSAKVSVRPKIGSTIEFKLSGNYQEDDKVKIKDFIPKKIKQSDFLLGLCKKFNLFIDYDTVKKELIILPKDDYYDLGKKRTDILIDASYEGNTIKFLPELVNKNLIFTDKLDSDLISKAYNENTKETYGQTTITFDNDHLYGTTTNETTFYSTPISRNSQTKDIYDGDPNNPTNISGSKKINKTTGNLLSYIDYSSTVNLKLVYDCGMIYTNQTTPFCFRIKTTNTLPTLIQSQTYSFTDDISAIPSEGKPQYNIGWIEYKNMRDGYYGYPFVGHFYPNPIDPTLDLNFGLCDYYAYSELVNTSISNNIFYRHYQRTIRQMNSGKLLSCRVKVDDISKLNFYDTYFINNAYWYLNKINSYDSNGGNFAEVEFINVI